MATISPNRQGLKDIGIFNIDAQFCQQYGNQVFNYNGDATTAYQQLCTDLSSIIDDLTTELQAVKAQIPTFSNVK